MWLRSARQIVCLEGALHAFRPPPIHPTLTHAGQPSYAEVEAAIGASPLPCALERRPRLRLLVHGSHPHMPARIPMSTARNTALALRHKKDVGRICQPHPVWCRARVMVPTQLPSTAATYGVGGMAPLVKLYRVRLSSVHASVVFLNAMRAIKMPANDPNKIYIYDIKKKKTCVISNLPRWSGDFFNPLTRLTIGSVSANV